MLGRWGNIIAGIWLVIAPWVLRYPDATARANDFWMGLATIAVALTAIRVSGYRFVNTGIGVWLVIAPVMLSYGSLAPVLNDVFVGFGIIAFSLVPQVRWRDIRRRETVVTPP